MFEMDYERERCYKYKMIKTIRTISSLEPNHRSKLDLSFVESCSPPRSNSFPVMNWKVFPRRPDRRGKFNGPCAANGTAARSPSIIYGRADDDDEAHDTTFGRQQANNGEKGGNGPQLRNVV